MKNTLFAAFLASTLISTASFAEAPAVLAKVNGRDVTKAEIEKALSNITSEELAGKAVYDKMPPDFQKAFVEKYIDKMLIIDAAKKAGLQNDPLIKQKVKEGEEALIQQKFLTDLVIGQTSEDKLKKTYEEKIKTKEGEEELHAQHILVKTEDEAKKIYDELKAGGDFEKIAKFKSIEPGAKMNAGDLGYFNADQMVPEFSAAALKLKKNEISEPVKTQFGWHVIKLLDKRKAVVPTFAQSKDAIQNELATKIIQAEADKLRTEAKIEYFGELVKTPAKPATPALKKVEDVK